ncbi:acyl-CoA dehydrogenase [Actinocorallia aurea]
MRFAPTEEHREFAASLEDLLKASDAPATARAWADGDHRPGLDLWHRLADVGVTALAVPEEHGGLGADTVFLTAAFEALGRHAVPGPWIEAVVLAPSLLAGLRSRSQPTPSLADISEGKAVVTAAAPPLAPYAPDVDVARCVLLLDGAAVHTAEAGEMLGSVDRARRLWTVLPGPEVGRLSPEDAERSLDLAAIACSARLLGAGERVLSEAVDYAKARRQFGRVIGEYQAVKHALADVRVALDFARPLLHGAAVTFDAGRPDAARDVSAAKVAASDAAYLAARTSLQVHGAIGYTEEHDLGLWLTGIRALVSAWGTPAAHRARILAAITAQNPLPSPA